MASTFPEDVPGGDPHRPGASHPGGEYESRSLSDSTCPAGSTVYQGQKTTASARTVCWGLELLL